MFAHKSFLGLLVSWTRDSINSNKGGNTIASMMLGLRSGGRIQYEPQPALQVLYGGVYFQDDWRVNGRLTLNLGLRRDADRPLTPAVIGLGSIASEFHLIVRMKMVSYLAKETTGASRKVK